MKPFSKQLICDSETPVSLYTKLAQSHPYAFLLESAEPHQTLGRYSVIGFDPLHLHVFPADGRANPLEVLRKQYESIAYTPDPNLPRLQAPFVGYFSYEVARHFEKLNLPIENAKIPEGIFFLPKNLLIFDHTTRSLTVITYDEKDLQRLLKEIDMIKNLPGPRAIPLESISTPSIKTPKNAHFEELVSAAKEKICAGEIFQIVISQIFEQKTVAHPFDLYRRLRLISPSPYMYYLQYPDFSIIGSSPETLVRTEGNEVVLRPIAGTRRRGKDPEEDRALKQELLHDIKEQAEHMMLVDLGRHDIGRMAVPGTVHVPKMMFVEKFSHVMHLVSEIRGKRRPDLSLFDMFRMSFPAGTLTGAPKIRAMEIIADFEKQPRDIYGGAVGYFDLSGNMDFAIAIRTMMYKSGVVTLRAGAGIVYDSSPAHENLECHHKARAPLTALRI